MKHCPYYKNREVFDGFNEIITSLGGKAMTEEEFKSSELRNQREGLDYSAMELAYRVYDRNGGNLLDMTPDGKPSILFQTLLDHFGNRRDAIVAKSNVYSDEFFNWFGDWTSENKENVSKVIDSNGEPLVVWHHTNDENLKEFKLDFVNYFQKDGGTNKAFFFDENTHGTLNRKYDLPVYLNIKNLSEFEGTKEGLHKQGTTYRAVVNKSAEDNGTTGGVHMKDFDDNKLEHQSIWITHSPTQIKHVANLGTWNPSNPNIYYLKNLNVQSIQQEDISYFTQTSLIDSFGQELSGKLMNGDTVSSRDLMNYMINNAIYHSSNVELARALARHDVPVRVGYTMRNGELAKTVTENGGSVIYINPNELSQVSRGYAGTTLIHELVHAITVDIIDNPKTEEDKAFVESNRVMYRRLSKDIKHLAIHAMNAQTAMYAFENEKEFAAVFASDPRARQFIYEYAERLDRINNGNKFTKALKNLVNRIIKAFGKRAIFNTQQNLSEELKEYENTLFSFLKDASIIERGNIPSKSRLHAVYNQIDQRVQNHEDFIENMKDLERMGNMQKNYLLGLKTVETKKESLQITSFEDIIKALQTRINAIKGSTYDSVVKGKLISQTQAQINMFLIEEGGRYAAINHLLKTAVPQLLEDLDEIRKIRKDGDVFTNSDYMYQRHANAGMYGAVFDQITKWLLNDENADEVIRLYNEQLPQDDEHKLTREDIDTLIINVQNATTFATQMVGHIEYMLKHNGIQKLRTLAENAGSPDMENYIEALKSTDSNLFIDDISLFESLMGPADASSNEAVRALAHMINTALNKAQMDSFDKSVDLQILQKGLKRGEKAWHCYEVDENGRFTGFLVRDLNFGRFKRDYDNEIIRINKILVQKFGLTGLNIKYNRVSPEGEDGARTAIVTIKEGDKEITKEFTAKEFFDYSKEMWLIDHCERKYTADYYKKYAQLPQSIKTQLQNIKTQINAITSSYKNLYDEKNIPHYEMLSDDDWIKLNQLWERRRFLSKDVDEFGHEKEGAELEAARQLRSLYKDLYHIDDNKEDTRVRDVAGWKRARNEIINQFGEDSEELEKWDERNSKKVFKKNEFGEAIVFKLIEKEFGDSKLFYSDKYEELKQRKKEILSNYRMPNGEYDADAMTTTIQNAIHTLDEEMDKERKRVKYGSATFASRQAAFSEIFKKHIKFVDSLQLKRAKKNAERMAISIAEQEADDDLFQSRSVEEIIDSILAERYGDLRSDSDLLDFGIDEATFEPYSYYTKMEAVDPNLMEVVPNDGWVVDKQDNNNLNPNFDESYGEAWVPKRSIYDNSEQYKKIKESETLRAMYDGLHQTIKEANDIMNLEYQDDYMLPQVECTALERLGRKGTLRSISRIFGWGRFYGRIEDPNDEERGEDYQEIVNSPEGGLEKLARTYPDGRDYHSIPRYFTKKLEHPELISKNAVGIVWDYYRNACKYKERSKIKDDCEMIADLIRGQKFKKSGREVGGDKGVESTTYQFVRNLIERDLYDIHRVKLFSKTIDYTKLTRLLQRLTTARNLGMSPKVAMVGFFTTMYTHMMNGITGYKYSFKDMSKSLFIVLKEFGLSLFGAKFFGQRLTGNKIMKLLELQDMADQGSRKLEHSNRNPIIQFLYKNSTFGLMTAADVIAKACILVATLLSYRLVDGKFMTRHEIEESRVSLGEDEYNRLMSEFNKSKVNAYNVILDDSQIKHPFKSKDKKIKVKEEYQNAWEGIKNRAMLTSLKNAEDADGIATRLQKAMMTRNAIGAFVLIHRQYIPLMLSKIFGKRVYDYDTHEYKNAQFRTMFQYINQLACSNVLATTTGGMFAGLAFGGFGMFPILLGGGASAIYYAIKQFQNKKKGIKRKTLKQVNQEFLGGNFLNIITNRSSKNLYTQDAKTYAEQVQNRYQLRQTMAEVLLYNILTIPTVNALCMCADTTNKDDDYWKWLLLQTLAYWARATQFETNAKYNMLDLASAIKTGTAAFGTIESYADILGGVGKAGGVMVQNLLVGHNQQADNISSEMYRLFVGYTGSDAENLSEYAFDEDYYGKSGAYKNYSKFFKSLMKTGPQKNIWEQLRDPVAKRRYQESQIMRMSKEDKQRSWIYDIVTLISDKNEDY